jgi:hypothetical protein
MRHQASTRSPIDSSRWEPSSALLLAWYYVEDRLTCRWVMKTSSVELTTRDEISEAA